LFYDYNTQIELVYLEPPMRLLLKQNHERSSSIAQNVIEKLAAKVEPPNWLDGHRIVFRNN